MTDDTGDHIERDKIEITKDSYILLLESHLKDKVIESVESRLLKRWTVFGSIVALILSVSGVFILKGLFSDSQSNLTATRTLIDDSRETIGSLKRKEQELQAAISDRRVELENLGKQIEAQTINFKAIQEDSIRISESIGSRVDKLTKLVSSNETRLIALEENSDVRDVNSIEIASSLARELDAQSQIYDQQIKLLQRKISDRENEVLIASYPGMPLALNEIHDTLKDDGVFVRYFEFNNPVKENEEHRVISIGTHVPTDLAKRILKSVAQIGEYINLVRFNSYSSSRDIIFIGSKNSSSENDLECRTLTGNEIEDLSNLREPEFREEISSFCKFSPKFPQGLNNQ